VPALEVDGAAERAAEDGDVLPHHAQGLAQGEAE
jgi:hypothetical protein